MVFMRSGLFARRETGVRFFGQKRIIHIDTGFVLKLIKVIIDRHQKP
jgi:hypothetical protein